MLSIHCNSCRRSWKKIKIKPFRDKHNWKGINYPSKKMTGKNEKSNPTIALNVL